MGHPIKPVKREPVKRVGIIGGGQLAWMVGPAAQVLGLELWVQTPNATDPAVAIATQTILADLQDNQATAQLAEHCDVITFENEFVDLPGLQPLADRGVCFFPTLQTLTPLLDKYDQRCYLRSLGLPTPEFLALGTIGDSPDNGSTTSCDPLNSQASSDLETFGFPVVLKARRHGYDGKGTEIITNLQDLVEIVQRQGREPFLLERFVPFSRELAVIAARSATGQMVIYPIVETKQRNQVCRVVLVPADLSPTLETQIQAMVETLLVELEVVGVIGIEFFLTAQDQVLINEIAPRTHNSGHYSLDACQTSQFEQQLRAVCGLPLASSQLQCPGAVMVNLLGYESVRANYLDQRQQLRQLPQAQVYWYGKEGSRPGRKLGHVTVLLPKSPVHLRRQTGLAMARTIEEIWYP
jgi:5-(carboxyamino)imidazole ribonucleotide synthase